MNLVLARSISLAALTLVCLSPVAKSASSDGFPWSNEQPGTIRLGDVAPGSSASASGVAQGNIGPTQSGPGAAGLFTPNNPGNAAAYNAQLTGALEGSPIVDGTGANIHISVPMATPSQTPGYLNYTVGATTPDNRNSYMHYNVQSTNPPFSPGFAQGTYGDLTNVFNGTSPGAQIMPESVRPSLSLSPTISSPATDKIHIQPLVFPQASTAVRATRFSPARRRLRPNEGLATTTTTTNLSFRQHIVKTPRTPTDALSLLGHVDGSIEYNDNQIVLFGANGTLRVNNNRTAVLTLTNGRVLTFHDPGNSMHQLATKHEVQL
ncbi:MAG TPA: hypothetical protein V6C69_15370 [Trichormus sp.]